MVNCLQLAFLAIVAAASVSAVDIKFRRYADADCVPFSHINKDTHLHDPHCKSFDPDEPAFWSFMVGGPEDHAHHLQEKDCKATVFQQKDCKGSGYTLGDMSDYINKCANTTIPGRSVRISCDAKQQKIVTGAMPTTRTRHHTVTVTHHQHVEVAEPTHTHTTTMVLYPKHSPACHMDCEDDDWY